MRSFKLHIILLSFLFLLMSCGKTKKVPKPKNLIPEEKMVPILVDLAKTNASISLNIHKYKQRGSKGKELILEKYHIDSLQLVQSNKYYTSRRKINERIYDSVASILQRERDSLQEIKKEEQRHKVDLKKSPLTGLKKEKK